MIGTIARSKERLVTAAGAAGIALAALVSGLALSLFSGTKTGTVMALTAVAGPLLLYATIFAPIAFPFGAYVALVPFNNLLDLPAFGTLTKVLAILAGGALIFYVVRTRRVATPPAALAIWGALLLWTAATAFWAIDTPSVFMLLPTAAELFALYAIVSVLPATMTQVRWVAVASIAGGVGAAAYGAYLFHKGTDIYYGDRLRITTDTSAIDPNHFGAALLLPISLCVIAALYSRKPLVVVLSVGALLTMFVGVAESASRGAAMGIGVMLIYLMIRSRKRIKLALCALPPLLCISLVNNGAIWGRFGQAVNSGGSGRLPIWKVGIAAAKAHWLLGAGYNNFPFAYDKAFLLIRQTQFVTWHRGAHNVLIGTTVEMGVVGLLLLVAAWIAQFRMLRVVPEDDADYPMRLALEAAMLGTFVAALFLDVMITKYVWLTFMLIVLLRNAHLPRSPRYA